MTSRNSVFVALMATVMMAVVLEVRAQGAPAECARDIYWSSSAGAGGDWGTTDNWVFPDTRPPAAPDVTSLVGLDIDPFNLASASSSVIDDQRHVSQVRLGAGHNLKIENGGKLLLRSVEKTCFGVNWCTGHGNCIGTDFCECEAGWTGEKCDIRVCDDAARDECGLCPDQEGFGANTCDCEDFLGRPIEEVDRLLLLYTNQEILKAVETTVQKLEELKELAGRYDPLDGTLQVELVTWLNALQNVCETCLEDTLVANHEFAVALAADVPVPDPCAADEELGV
ncbi:hypothetical protein QOT17_019846 [Balamuthia mandrillaris]